VQFNDISITKYQQNNQFSPPKASLTLIRLMRIIYGVTSCLGSPEKLTNLFFEKNIPWEGRWIPFKSVTLQHSHFQNAVDTYPSPRL